ncbi:MAG TPA: hypothetical protein ENN40_06625 [Candidatus Aminicenantes bacterium]|nr:hypothetical protein [Candidatus Aminicenantes bacterium]
MVKNDMLDLNLSFLVILGLVWILMLILNRLFFAPIGDTINRREAMVAEDERRLEELNTGIQEGTRNLETSLNQARQQSLKLREELIEHGESTREELVADARRSARETMEKEMSRLEKEIQSAEARLKEQADEFSAKISEIFQ